MRIGTSRSGGNGASGSSSPPAGVSDWSARTTLRTSTPTTTTTMRTTPPSARGTILLASEKEQQHVNAVAAARERFSYVETQQGKNQKKVRRRKVDSNGPTSSSPATLFSAQDSQGTFGVANRGAPPVVRSDSSTGTRNTDLNAAASSIELIHRDDSAAQLKRIPQRTKNGSNDVKSNRTSNASKASQGDLDPRVQRKFSEVDVVHSDDQRANAQPIASNEEPVRRKTNRFQSTDPLRTSASPSRARQFGCISRSVDGTHAAWTQLAAAHAPSPLRQSYSSPLLSANVRGTTKAAERAASGSKQRTTGGTPAALTSRPFLTGTQSPTPTPNRTLAKQQQQQQQIGDASSMQKGSGKTGSGAQKKKRASNPSSPAGPSSSSSLGIVGGTVASPAKGNGLTRQRSRTLADTATGTSKRPKTSRGVKNGMTSGTSKSSNTNNSSSAEPVRRTLSRMESAVRTPLTTTTTTIAAATGAGAATATDASPSRGDSVCRLSRHNTSVSRHNSISQNSSWRLQSRRQSMYGGLPRQSSHQHSHHSHHHHQDEQQELAPSSPVTIVMEGILNAKGEDTTILSTSTKRRTAVATSATSPSSLFPDHAPEEKSLQPHRHIASDTLAERYDSDMDAKDETRARSRRIEARALARETGCLGSSTPANDEQDVMSDQLSLNSSESDSSIAQRLYSQSQQRPSEGDLFAPAGAMFKILTPHRTRNSSLSQNQKGSGPSKHTETGASARDDDCNFSPSSRAGSLESSMSFDEEDEEEAVQQYMSSGWYSGTLRMPSTNTTPSPSAAEYRAKAARASKRPDEANQASPHSPLVATAQTAPAATSPKKTAKELVLEYKIKNGLIEAPPPAPESQAPVPTVTPSATHSHSELLSKERDVPQASAKPLIMKSRGNSARALRDTTAPQSAAGAAPRENESASQGKDKQPVSRLASMRRSSIGNYNAASTSRRPSTCNGGGGGGNSRRNSNGMPARMSTSSTLGTTSTAPASKRVGGCAHDAAEAKGQPAPVVATAVSAAAAEKVPHEITHSAVHATGTSRTATPSRMERSGRRTGHTYIANLSARRCGTPQMQHQDRAASNGLAQFSMDKENVTSSSVNGGNAGATGSLHATLTPRMKEAVDSMKTMQKAPLSSTFVEQLTSKLSLYDAFFLDETKSKWLVDDCVLAKVLEYVRLLGYEHPMLKEDELAGRISLWADSTVTPSPIVRTAANGGTSLDNNNNGINTNTPRVSRGASATADSSGTHANGKHLESQRRYQLLHPASCKGPSKSLFLDSSEGLRWLAEQEYVVGTILLCCCFVEAQDADSCGSSTASPHAQSDAPSHADANDPGISQTAPIARPYLNPAFHPITFCATYVVGSHTNWGDLSSFKDMWESQVKLVFTPFAPNHQKTFYYDASISTGMNGGVVSGDAAMEGYRAIMETHREPKGSGCRRDKASPSRSSSAGGTQAPKTPREAPQTYTRLCFLSSMDSGNLMHVECAALPTVSAASGLHPTTPRARGTSSHSHSASPADQPQPSPRQQQHAQAHGASHGSQGTPVSPGDDDDDDNSSSDGDGGIGGGGGGAALPDDAAQPMPSPRRQKGQARKSKSCFVETPALPLFSTTAPLFNFWLEPDSGSDKRLWFYFAIAGAMEGVPIQMRLMNAAPHLKLYRNGMKPVWRAGSSQPYWTTAEHCVFRVKNGGLDGELMFVIHPKCSSEMILVAFCVPYSYSDMLCHISHWHSLVKHSICSIRFEERVLTRTPDGRKMHLLIITSPNSKITRHTQHGKAGSSNSAASSYAMNSSGPHSLMAANGGNLGGANNSSNSNNNTNSAGNSNGAGLLSLSSSSAIVGPYTNFTSGKKVVLISCRVHPGEVTASHGAHGLVSFLLSSDPRAAALREHFIFYIVPMLNPDGVSRGHSRHDQRGLNLNRCYNDPDPVQQPTVCALRRVFEHLQCTFHDRFFMYIDFHSHASRSTGFIFGNYLPVTVQHWNMVFPRIIELHAREVFSFYQCRFGRGQMLSKDGTSRVLFGGTLIHSYTVELTHFTNFRCYSDDVEALNNGSPVFSSTGTLVGSRKAIEKQLAARSVSAGSGPRKLERSASKTKVGGVGTPRKRQSDMIGRYRKDERETVNNLSFHSACNSGKSNGMDGSPTAAAGGLKTPRSRAKSTTATTAAAAAAGATQRGKKAAPVCALSSASPHIPSILCNSADIGRACVLALLDYCAIPYPGCTYGGTLNGAPLRNRASNVGSQSNGSNGSFAGSPFSANGSTPSRGPAKSTNGSGSGAGPSGSGSIGGPVPMSGEFWSYGGMERVLREVKRQIRGN